MDDDQQFCLRWNNHQSTLISVFDTLLEKGIHVDCTLAAEGQTLKAHKVVLSACSPYFESVLSQQYDKHPIIILKDVKFAELRAMMDYMYRGEVNISQDQLGALLKAAESLQIKGLSDSKPPSAPAQPAVPRPVSPPPKVAVVGKLSPCAEDRSREGSLSPARRKRKKRRTSLSPAPLLLNNNPPTPPDTHHDTMAKLKLLQPNHEPLRPEEPAPLEPATLEPKAELPKPEPEEDEGAGGPESVEDLTLDEEADSEGEHAGTSHSLQDSTGFAWHLDRSQDELTVGQDGQRDSTDRVTRSSAPRTPQNINQIEDPVIDLDMESSLLDDTDFGDAQAQEAAVLSLLSESTDKAESPTIPDTFLVEKARLMEENFLQNNNIITKEEQDSKFYPKCESDAEYDDFDDILLPDESEVFGSSMEDSLKEEECVRRSRGRSSGAEPPQQFECRHCGKRYRWKSTLRRHESVECGGKPPSHACPYCMYRAKQRGNLGVHIRKHHNAEWTAFANTKLRKTKKFNV